jgi:hypothetical protein
MIAGNDQWSVVSTLHLEHWATENPGSAVLSVVAFLMLCIFMARAAMNVRKD